MKLPSRSDLPRVKSICAPRLYVAGILRHIMVPRICLFGPWLELLQNAAPVRQVPIPRWDSGFLL